MRRTDRGERLFYHALAAMVFAAVCAWSAAALFARVAGPRAPDGGPAAPETAPPGRFRGVLLRREETLPAGAFPGTETGARLSAGETGTESALFFPASDGWEFLSPADAGRITPERLEALLDAAPFPAQAAPRLVYGFSLVCVALFAGDAPPAPGPCRLTPDGRDEGVPAELLSVSTDALGRTLLCLRLTEIPAELYELRVIAGEITA